MTNFIPDRIITGEQIKGARAMLRLDQKEFAALAHLTVGAIKRMERTRGPITVAIGVLEAMRLALESAGIEFIEAGRYEGVGGPGVRFKGEPIAGGDVIDFEKAAEELGDEKQSAKALGQCTSTHNSQKYIFFTL